MLSSVTLVGLKLEDVILGLGFAKAQIKPSLEQCGAVKNPLAFDYLVAFVFDASNLVFLLCVPFSLPIALHKAQNGLRAPKK